MLTCKNCHVARLHFEGQDLTSINSNQSQKTSFMLVKRTFKELVGSISAALHNAHGTPHKAFYKEFR